MASSGWFKIPYVYTPPHSYTALSRDSDLFNKTHSSALIDTINSRSHYEIISTLYLWMVFGAPCNLKQYESKELDGKMRILNPHKFVVLETFNAQPKNVHEIGGGEPC